jgi:hypothetical protein
MPLDVGETEFALGFSVFPGTMSSTEARLCDQGASGSQTVGLMSR